MGPQQGQDPVLGLDLTAQDPAQVREADKPLQQVGLSVQVPDGGGHRVECLI